METALKLIDLGGGWYERPDGEKVQLKAEEVADYEAALNQAPELDRIPDPGAPGGTAEAEALANGGVEDRPADVPAPVAPTRPVDPMDSLPAPPPVAMPSNIDEGIQTGQRVELPPVPGSTFPIGPYNDYAFVTTPWGEFAIPKGKYITGVEEIKDPKDPEKISYRAIYDGEFYTRSKAERDEWLRQSEAERRAKL